MNLYVESNLANHRHGRFFISQLDAVPADDMPSSGLVFMHGKTFQMLDSQQQSNWWEWASKPGRVFLLLPPFNLSSIFEKLDWQISAREDEARLKGSIIPETLAPEVNVSIIGSDGEFDRLLGHEWMDHSINSRFFKQHQGCGVFAATTLPLWSISLLDHAQDTLEWLDSLMAFTGEPGEYIGYTPLVPEVHLEPSDYTLMVCMQAWGIHTVDAITSALEQRASSMIAIPGSVVVEGIARLQELGYVDDKGLTDIGMKSLSESPYWGYVESLREEAPL